MNCLPVGRVCSRQQREAQQEAPLPGGSTKWTLTDCQQASTCSSPAELYSSTPHFHYIASFPAAPFHGLSAPKHKPNGKPVCLSADDTMSNFDGLPPGQHIKVVTYRHYRQG